MATTELAMHTYNGYKITVRPPKETEILARVAVFDPRFPRDAPLYKATSLDEAMKWIDAYRTGRH